MGRPKKVKEETKGEADFQDVPEVLSGPRLGKNGEFLPTSKPYKLKSGNFRKDN